jgi:hypothetical protein
MGKYLINDTGRECSGCGEFKEWEEFGKDKSSSSGHKPTCKVCSHGNYLLNRNKEIERQKEYREKNREEIASKNRDLYHLNQNMEILRSKEYRKKNPEKRKETQKNYRNGNKDKIRTARREKRKNDPLFRLEESLRSRVSKALKNQNAKKYHCTMDLIGCSPSELGEYLESLWIDGMTWDNYGFYGWHMDHINPCASFDLADTEQQKQCFHYTNLQPMLWQNNLSKGSRKEKHIEF